VTSEAAVVRATELATYHTLADGTLVLHTSHQPKWIYVQGFNTTGGGRVVKRRYRHDQMVKIAVDDRAEAAREAWLERERQDAWDRLNAKWETVGMFGRDQ
jgi:hypothetical protein